MKEYRFFEHRLGDVTAIYSVVDGIMQFTAVPYSQRKYVLQEKLVLEGRKYNAPDGAVQAHVFGDAANRQYSAGQTMRNSASAFTLKFAGQTKTEEGGRTEIVSRLERSDGQRAFHHLVHRKGEKFLEIYTVYENGSERPITLEMLSSFSVGSLSPFQTDNDPESIEIYRMRSQWSSEAKLEKQNMQALILEPSWMNYGARGERFGSLGSMPAKKFMPFIGFTDKKRKVTWAASLGCSSSWQMEFYLSQNSVNLSGGLADFEFGHWRKTLAPSEKIETPHAFFTAVAGDIDRAAQVLTCEQLRTPRPASEEEMPVLYNDWCCNWGNCSRENLLPLIGKAAKFGAKYFVIDAGWFEAALDENGLHISPKKEFYPNGLEEITELIRSEGMIPGLWFEPESREAPAGADLARLPVLKRGGAPIRNLERIFLDMTDKRVAESLKKSVVGTLKKYGIGYIKVDYNENIGIGCDGAESLGEGLRRQIAAAENFYRETAKAVPGLVMEMCSSGGMRCVPSVIALGSMMSFSDIHETEDEPVVACDMQRVLHPSKSQIWATLHENDSLDRLLYTLACGFYGRLCLSGHIEKLNAAQTELTERALKLYREVSHIIENGFTYFIGKTPPQRFLSGYKGCARVSADKKSALVTVHCFDGAHPKIRIKNAALRGMEIAESLLPEGADAEICEEGVILRNMRKTTAAVLHLKNRK